MADNHMRERLETALQEESVELIDLPVSLLEEITDDFSKDGLLGKGGFGNVYTGTLRNGLVAVKKISDVVEKKEEKSEDVVKRFCREFLIMMDSKHENIVRFLGYSFDVKFTKDGKSAERKMYICSEYMPNGSLHEYIKDETCRFQWSTRNRIIRGIVDGVHYLHTTGSTKGPTIHKDLKPSNVLLDHNMVPKITDFGTSRRFDRGQSYSYTQGGIVSLGYTAQELAQTGIFTTKSDMYSLGVIIMDLLVGHEKSLEFVREGTLGGDILAEVLGSWKNVHAEGQVLKQVQVCAEMAIRCMDSDLNERTDKSIGLHYQRERRPAADRPAAYEIISRLRQVENSTWSALRQINEWSTGPELLDVHPRVLCFPLITWRQSHSHSYLRKTSCLLQLTNNTNQSVGFWIVPQFPKLYRFESSCCGVVKPGETHVVNVILVEGKRPPLDTGEFNVLTVAWSETNSNAFMSVIEDGENALEMDRVVGFLKRIKELGQVHEAVLTAVIRPSRTPKVIRNIELESEVSSIDLHPTEPWILTYRNHDLKLYIWNYQTQNIKEIEIRKVGSKKFIWPGNPGKRQEGITSARFMAAGLGDGAPLIVIGDASGYIRAMTYGTGKTKTSIIASHYGPVTAVAVHPTRPLVASAGLFSSSIVTWNGEKNWTLEDYYRGDERSGIVTHIKFGTDTFAASPEKDGTIETWSYGESLPNKETVPQERAAPSFICSLFGAFDYLRTPGDGKYMITTTKNGACIWDLQTKPVSKVHNIVWKSRDNIIAVACHPVLPFIFAVTKDPDNGISMICFWNYISYNRLGKIHRIERTFRGLRQLGFVGSQRIVVIHEMKKIEVLEIELKILAYQQGTDNAPTIHQRNF